MRDDTMRVWRLFIGLVLNYVHLTSGQRGCPTDGVPVIRMCKGGSVTAKSLLMDFFGASTATADTCKCTVLTIKGDQFHFSQIKAPGYVGCGTEIHVQKDVRPRGGDVIRCTGGTSIPGLSPGNTLTIKLLKHTAPFDVKYCYRLDISGHLRPSMTVTCDKVPEEITTQKVTEQTIVSMTTETFWNTSSAISTDVFNYTTTKSPITFQDCEASALYSAIAALLVVLTTVAAYAIFITYKFVTVPRGRTEREPSSAYTDIYEEIPARTYMSSRPVYNDSFKSPGTGFPPDRSQENTRSNCHHCNSKTSQSQGHWNWTYDEKGHDNNYEKPEAPHIYEYQNERF